MDGKEVKEYNIQEGLLFYKNRLCIPADPLRQQLILTLHYGGLAGHLGRDKVTDQLKSRFYWLRKLACSFCHRDQKLYGVSIVLQKVY